MTTVNYFQVGDDPATSQGLEHFEAVYALPQVDSKVTRRKVNTLAYRPAM